jgi:hypothetical protein
MRSPAGTWVGNTRWLFPKNWPWCWVRASLAWDAAPQAGCATCAGPSAGAPAARPRSALPLPRGSGWDADAACGAGPSDPRLRTAATAAKSYSRSCDLIAGLARDSVMTAELGHVPLPALVLDDQPGTLFYHFALSAGHGFLVPALTGCLRRVTYVSALIGYHSARSLPALAARLKPCPFKD